MAARNHPKLMTSKRPHSLVDSLPESRSSHKRPLIDSSKGSIESDFGEQIH